MLILYREKVDGQDDDGSTYQDPATWWLGKARRKLGHSISSGPLNKNDIQHNVEMVSWHYVDGQGTGDDSIQIACQLSSLSSMVRWRKSLEARRFGFVPGQRYRRRRWFALWKHSWSRCMSSSPSFVACIDDVKEVGCRSQLLCCGTDPTLLHRPNLYRHAYILYQRLLSAAVDWSSVKLNQLVICWSHGCGWWGADGMRMDDDNKSATFCLVELQHQDDGRPSIADVSRELLRTGCHWRWWRQWLVKSFAYSIAEGSPTDCQ